MSIFKVSALNVKFSLNIALLADEVSHNLSVPEPQVVFS